MAENSGSAGSGSKVRGASEFSEKAKETDVRTANIFAAKAVADCVRTSLGPKGMDKMIVDESGDVLITNDGATILKKMKVIHPAAKMIVELSKAQDIEVGDGTTSIVIISGELLNSALKLTHRGIHPSIIASAFQLASVKAKEVLNTIAQPVDLGDEATLIKSATTSLSSKVVSQNAPRLAPIAVRAVLRVIDPATANNVDFRDIKVVTKLGGTIDDTELIDGLVFPQGAAHSAGGPTRITNAKIGLIQFCLSPPKANMDNQVVISNYTQMDRACREEQKYLLDLCRTIKNTGCNVLLIQKSILRDAVTDTSLHFLAKMKILVVRDIERSDIEFISKTLGCTPIASIEGFNASKLGSAELVEQAHTSGGKVVKVTGVANPGRTVTIFCRGSNKMLLDECERSVHDALCVVRSLVKRRYMIPGGGAPEIEISLRLAEWAKTLGGLDSFCVRSFAEALEIIPYTLAENAGLNPVSIVTELRNKHAQGEVAAGINVRKGAITNIWEENVLQPLLVTESILTLATEAVAMILKIDDILAAR